MARKLTGIIAISGERGPIGPQGPVGPAGPQGPVGPKGEDGSQVSVSSTGTSTDEVSYITIDDQEYKLSGGYFKVVDGELCIVYKEDN